MKTKIVKCNCKHESQDKMYGKGMRLANKCGTPNVESYRCTVCREVRK